MPNTYKWQQLIPLRQKAADQYVPSQQQITQYGQYIGLYLPGDQQLLYIAQQGIKAQLPQQWQACQTTDQQMVYRNTITKQIQEQHPLDQYYRKKVILIKQKEIEEYYDFNKEYPNDIDYDDNSGKLNQALSAIQQDRIQEEDEDIQASQQQELFKNKGLKKYNNVIQLKPNKKGTSSRQYQDKHFQMWQNRSQLLKDFMNQKSLSLMKNYDNEFSLKQSDSNQEKIKENNQLKQKSLVLKDDSLQRRKTKKNQMMVMGKIKDRKDYSQIQINSYMKDGKNRPEQYVSKQQSKYPSNQQQNQKNKQSQKPTKYSSIQQIRQLKELQKQRQLKIYMLDKIRQQNELKLAKLKTFINTKNDKQYKSKQNRNSNFQKEKRKQKDVNNSKYINQGQIQNKQNKQKQNESRYDKKQKQQYKFKQQYKQKNRQDQWNRQDLKNNQVEHKSIEQYDIKYDFKDLIF